MEKGKKTSVTSRTTIYNRYSGARRPAPTKKIKNFDKNRNSHEYRYLLGVSYEREVKMLRKDLIKKDPSIQIMGKENLHKGQFGAVLSRAGVGKTQFLVHIALSWLLEGENILHISLDDPMDKINIRYKEAYFTLIDSIGYVDPQKAVRLWENIDICKTGISYNEATFAPEKIKDYLHSFEKEDLRIPGMLVIDGLNFDKVIDEQLAKNLEKLKKISSDFSISMWFSMRTHRDEPLSSDGYPKQFEMVQDIFDKAVFLRPKENMIEAIVLKDGDKADQKYLLDPATMMAY